MPTGYKASVRALKKAATPSRRAPKEPGILRRSPQVRVRHSRAGAPSVCVPACIPRTSAPSPPALHAPSGVRAHCGRQMPKELMTVPKVPRRNPDPLLGLPEETLKLISAQFSGGGDSAEAADDADEAENESGGDGEPPAAVVAPKKRKRGSQ